MPTQNQHTAQIQANTVTRAKLTLDNGGITNTEISYEQTSMTSPPAAPPPNTVSFTVKINGQPASRGRVRVIDSVDRYRGANDDADPFYPIGNNGTVSNVVTSPGEYVVIEAYDTDGNVFSKVITLTSGSPSIPDPVNINEAILRAANTQLPVGIEVQWGLDSNNATYRPVNWPGTPADQREYLLDRLFGTAANYLSIGQGGRIHMWFDPPLPYNPNVETLIVSEQGSAELYNVMVGNAPVNDILNVNQINNWNTGGAGSYAVRGTGAANQTINYVKIECLDAGADDVVNNPGLDINQIQLPNNRIDGVYILLDLSGSMFRPMRTGDGETVKQADDAVNNPAPLRQRLYQVACKEILEILLPQSDDNGGRLPIYFEMFCLKPNDTQATVFQDVITVTGTTRLVDNYPPDGSVLRARLQTLAMQAIDSAARHYTPLCSAINQGINNLPASISKPLIIVISDGIGSVKFGDTNVNETFKDVVLPGSRSGYLEFIGFRIPWGGLSRPERADVFTYKSAANWITNIYDARSNIELRDILRGVRLKHDLDRVGVGLAQPPEINWLRNNINDLPNTNNILDDIHTKWPGQYYTMQALNLEVENIG